MLRSSFPLTARLALLVLSFIPFITSCYYDLETIIDKSKNGPITYGSDLYWNGYLVGRTYKPRKSDEKAIMDALAKEGWYRDSTVRIPEKVEQYMDSFGKWKTRVVPAKVLVTELTSKVVKNRSGKWVIIITQMDVPAAENVWESEFFVYVIEEKQIYRAGKTAGRRSLWPHELVPYFDKYLPPDLEPHTKAAYQGLDPFNDFETRKKITLGEGTEKSQTLVYLNTGIDFFKYVGISSTAIVNKADTKLKQSIAPLMLAYVSGDISWKNIFLKGDFRCGLMGTGSFAGGRDAAEEMGAGKKSYLYDLAAGFHGIETKVTVQRWNFGSSAYYTSAVQGSRARNQLVYRDSFVLEKRQIDAAYHFLWQDIPRLGGQARNRKMWDLYAGYRYMSYDRPGIIYRYRSEKIENSEDKRIVVRGESGPQTITIGSHLVGAGINNYMRAVKPGWNVLCGLSLYGGCGSTRADVVDDYGDAPRKKTIGFGVLVPGGTIGLQYNFGGERLNGGFRLAYSNDMYVLMHQYGTCPDNIFEMFQTLSLSAELRF
jgi:hypothetical protein